MIIPNIWKNKTCSKPPASGVDSNYKGGCKNGMTPGMLEGSGCTDCLVPYVPCSHHRIIAMPSHSLTAGTRVAETNIVCSVPSPFSPSWKADPGKSQEVS